MDYQWFCIPPIGRSRGILVGFNTTTLAVQDVVTGDRCVKFYINSKLDNYKWALVGVYGAAQDEHKVKFLAELVRICVSHYRFWWGETSILADIKRKRTMKILTLDGLLYLMPL
jgi:hypothetical protein